MAVVPGWCLVVLVSLVRSCRRLNTGRVFFLDVCLRCIALLYYLLEYSSSFRRTFAKLTFHFCAILVSSFGMSNVKASKRQSGAAGETRVSAAGSTN